MYFRTKNHTFIHIYLFQDKNCKLADIYLFHDQKPVTNMHLTVSGPKP